MDRGSIIFISQCDIKSFNNNNNDRSNNSKNNKSNNDNDKDNNYNDNTNDDDNDKKNHNIILKLSIPYGTLQRLIVADQDISVAGICRGSYPKLYQQADFLSLWCKSLPSIFLSR